MDDNASFEVACEEGRYENFTGVIMWGDNEGSVENANFELRDLKFAKVIVFHSGIWWNGFWKDGLWHTGIWFDGTWHNGVWVDGYWHTGTWENGNWYAGLWKGGTWKDGWWHGGIWRGGKWVKGIRTTPDRESWQCGNE